MSGALSKLILVFAVVSFSTLAVELINYKSADLPDFHRYDGYGEQLQREDYEFIPTGSNRSVNVNLTSVVFSLNSAI